MRKSNNKLNKIINNILFILSLFSLIGVFFYFAYDYKESVNEYSERLEQTIKSKDEQIRYLEKQNSLNKDRLANKNMEDSLNTDYRDLNKSFIQYANELSGQLSEAYKKINILNDSLIYYKVYYDFSQKKFNHMYSVKSNPSGGRTFGFKDNAVPMSTYNNCKEQNNSYKQELFELQRELDINKKALNKYDIVISKDIIDISEESYSTHYRFNSLKVDSALMLLNIYNDKIKYNEKNDEWIIGGRNIIRPNNNPDLIIGTTHPKTMILNQSDSTQLINKKSKE